MSRYFSHFSFRTIFFWFNCPLRQYFSLYRAVSQTAGEREEKGKRREKMSKPHPTAPTASAVGPCPTLIQVSRTPRHWKITQHHRTTRPSPDSFRTIHIIAVNGYLRFFTLFFRKETTFVFTCLLA